MNYSQFKKRAKHYLRKQLSLTHYIDVEKAEENIRKNIPFQGPNIYILFVAIVIASVGLNTSVSPKIPFKSMKYGIQFLPDISCGAGFYFSCLRRVE